MTSLDTKTHKRCPDCEHTKPVTEFDARPGTPYLLSYCRVCRRERNRIAFEKKKAQPDLYKKYRSQLNAYHAVYKARRTEEGRPLYIPLQERFQAIMQLI